MGGEWKWTITSSPPSVNSLHNVIWSQRKVELKPEIRKWRNDVMLTMPVIRLASDESLIEIDLTFHYRHLYRNGKLRRFDTHNLIKALLDAISAKANFDDSRIKTGSWRSVDSEDERVEVTLREV